MFCCLFGYIDSVHQGKEPGPINFGSSPHARVEKLSHLNTISGDLRLVSAIYIHLLFLLKSTVDNRHAQL